MLTPSRLKCWLGFTLTVINRSPFTPLTDWLPLPLIRKFTPSKTPRGILITSSTSYRTVPIPLQVGHAGLVLPKPLQWTHLDWAIVRPSSCSVYPFPSQCSQTDSTLPRLNFEPRQEVQISFRANVNFRSQPVTVWPNSSSTVLVISLPFRPASLESAFSSIAKKSSYSFRISSKLLIS